MITTISADLLARLLQAAAASPDREICGLLFGTAFRIEDACEAANVAADPGDSFEIDPRTLLAAHKAARGGGPAILGCYHSHPSGSATPSARDRAAAAEGSFWLILARGEARLWCATREGFTGHELRTCK